MTDRLAERNVGLWVLDPYSRAYVGSLDNGNDEAQVGAFLDTLDVIKAESGVSELVIPVHTPKARAEAGEETAIGSQRLEGWPDALWYLTKDLTTGSRFLRAEGRDIEVEEQQLSFDPATRALTLGGGSRAEHRQHADAATVSAFVAEHHGCSARDICSGLGWGNDRVRRAVESSRDKVRVVEGKNRSRQHYPVDLLVEVSSAPGAPEHSGAPVQSGALHSIESTTRAPSTTEMEEQDPLGDIEDLLGGAA